VAIVGASGDPRKWGGSLLRNVVEGGYPGRIYPVNPRGGEFFGLPTYTSLADLPEVPELVLVVLGAAQTGEVVAECTRLSVPAVVAIAAGYSEAGPEGRRMEAELAAVVEGAGSTLVGPNCMGVLSGSARLNAVGFVTLRPESGSLSVISQSGNIGTQMLMAAERRGIGIEKFISVGNQACTTAVDVLDHLAHDRRTGVVIMYIEEVGDGRRFFEVARRTTARKPVVVIRGGSTAAGSRAAASHTGAMAGSTEVFAAAARQAGVILSDDPDESLDIAAALAYLPLPRGRRVGVVTLGGGWGVLTADELARNGLELAVLPAEVVRQIDELLPAFWSHGNPVDLVASVHGETPQKVLRLVAESETVDAVLALALLGSPSSGRDRQGAEDGELNDAEQAIIRCVAETMERTAKPIIAVPLCPVTRSIHRDYGAYAPLVLPTPRSAVLALARMVEHADHLGKPAPAGHDGESERRHATKGTLR
jgi:acyl-CoA synthetase (NDP forming)